MLPTRIGAAAAAIAAVLALGVYLAPGLQTMSSPGRGGAQSPQDTTSSPGGSTEVMVVDVVDGDTLRVATPAGRDLGRVRLLGIDAPEVEHPPHPAECYGATATRTLAALVPEGTNVTLVEDPTQDSRDVYGRLLRYVDHDGRDVSRQLLEDGAVRLYDARPEVLRADDYTAAAEEAREAGRGLWGAC